jgi:dipeptidyl-peptidase-4
MDGLDMAKERDTTLGKIAILLSIGSFMNVLGAVALTAGVGQGTADAKQTERETMYHRYQGLASLIKGGSIKAHWMSDGRSFWYAEGAPHNTVIYKVDPGANSKTPLFDVDRTRSELARATGHAMPYSGLPFDDFMFIENEKGIKFSFENRPFIMEISTYEIVPGAVQPEAEMNRFVPRQVRKGFAAGAPDVMEVLSPDRKWFALERDHNLYVRSTCDSRIEPVTNNGITDSEWSVSGAKWSPDSSKLAVTQIDSRNVPYMPLVHWLKPIEEVESVHYTKSGQSMAQTVIYIVDVLSKQPVRVDTGGSIDQRILLLTWLPDGSELLLVRADREFKSLDLMAANARTGSARIIVRETQPSFVVGIPFSGPAGFHLLDNGKRFIWISERDGWRHLYLYGIDGTEIRRLTAGEYPVGRVVTADERAGWVYFTAHGEKRVYDTHLYRVNFEGRGFTRLTEAPGQHDVAFASTIEGIEFSPSKEYFLDAHSSLDRPPAVELRRADGKLLRVISESSLDGLKDLRWKAPEEFTVKAADGKTELWGAMFKPANFDPDKKYPVLDFIYNGPQVTWVPRSFLDGRSLSAQTMSQLGFIVIIVDGRGTPERGKAFQDVVYRNFGRNEIPDHVATLRELGASRPYMDLGRVGIYGGSWGGYMTIRALVLAPEMYRVGVASIPVADLYDHPASAIEPYMGLPQNDRAGYEYASSLRLVANLKGHLLLIAGTSDVNAPFSAAVKMVEACIRAGKPVDFVVLPEQDHNPTGASLDYLVKAQRKYFEEHLKP